MLDLHRLTLLREVKLHGSMSAAARELSYSHSAISQQLALLEREAGVVLLEKAGRNVRLTAAGEELVRNTETILAAVERAESDLASANQQPRGVLTIAAFPTIGRSVMPKVLTELAHNYPELDLRLQVVDDPEEATIRLISRHLDAVMTDAFPGTQGAPAGAIHATVLAEDPVRGYLPDATIDSADRIRQLRWVMEPGFTASTQWALRVCRERGFEPVVAHESSDLLFHLRMVEQGLAAAFLPDMLIREAGSTLTPSEWLTTGQTRSILYLVRSGSESHPSLLAVRDAMVAALA